MHATQLSGQADTISFKPVPWCTSSSKRDWFLLPWPFFGGEYFCFALWRLHDDDVVVDSSYGAPNVHFAQGNSINWADSASRTQTQANWNKHRMCMPKEERDVIKNRTLCVHASMLAVCVFPKNPLSTIFKNVCQGSSKTQTRGRNTTNLRISKPRIRLPGF